MIRRKWIILAAGIPVVAYVGLVVLANIFPVYDAAFADGSVRFLRTDTDEKVLRALFTRNGGERLDPDELQ